MTISRSISLACIGILIVGTACHGGNVGYKTEDSPAGLKQLMERFYQAARADDNGVLEMLCRSLLLPDPDAWFTRVVGPEKGAALAAEYRKQQHLFVMLFKEEFPKIVAKEQSVIHVKRYSDPGDMSAAGKMRKMLAEMRERTDIYSVRFVKPGEPFGIQFWPFVYVDGGFRFAGKMRLPRRLD